ncbi:Hypothetical protein D9617_18g033080 [Elsinoe fawcettii]|nr:Hypothetical protein D9617_18g033080 [Elsinoe fawcettii]
MATQGQPSRHLEDVMSNPQVFEMIFSHLSIPDLLFNTRSTCRNWRSGLDASPKLLKKLFLLPDLPPRKLDISKCPFDGEKHDGGIEHPNDCFFCAAPEPDKVTEFPARLANPLLCSKAESEVDWHKIKITADTIKLFRNDENPNSAWRQMYLTQPPLTELSIVLVEDSARFPPVTLRDPNGIKMQAVLDACEAECDRTEDRWWIEPNFPRDAMSGIDVVIPQNSVVVTAYTEDMELDIENSEIWYRLSETHKVYDMGEVRKPIRVKAGKQIMLDSASNSQREVFWRWTTIWIEGGVPWYGKTFKTGQCLWSSENLLIKDPVLGTPNDGA